VDEGLKLGLEGIVEKFSATLNRNAAWKKIQRISKLPVFLCVQFLRFFWKPTPESRDHTGLKCKILRPVQFTEVSVEHWA
jgi:ubiquitin carboxyl-terminal hydrolase 14